MAHMDISPEMYVSGRYQINSLQQTILDVMDSCRVTIIPGFRRLGVTTIIQAYIEWEFLYSSIPLEVTYGSTSRYDGGFHSINGLRVRDDTYRNGGNEIHIANNKSILDGRSLRGTCPSNLYVFDPINPTDHEQLLCFMREVESRKGMRRYILNKPTGPILYNNFDPTELCSQTISFEGGRYVIVTDEVEYLIDDLLRIGFSSDDIGLVRADPRTIAQEVSRNIGPQWKFYTPYGTLGP